tara:strand:- start:5478 stop:6020 length:543 start_codon:yes stop_codon:yes gene_type:complete
MVEKIREFISAGDIQHRVGVMAWDILYNLKADEFTSGLNFVTVLDGARPFARDLITELGCKGLCVSDSFVKLNSYCGTKSNGKICIEQDLTESLEGKDVLVVEDIVDSGRTYDFLRNYLLNEKGVRNVKLASLLSKPSRRVVDVKIDYLGIEIPDEFVVGYGMDFNGKYRELDYMGILED